MASNMRIVNTRDTLSEIYLDAIRIRHEVFMVEQLIPVELEIDEEEALCIHFVLYKEEKASVTCRLLPKEVEHKFVLQRMATIKEERGLGLGNKLLEEVFDFVSKQKGFEVLEIHAQKISQKFYEKAGFTVLGKEFEEAGIIHTLMQKKI